jgi:hypothetical protein
MTFSFDSSGFRRNLEKTVNAGMQDLARQFQQRVDRVQRSSSGRPVDDVMVELREALRGPDWKFTDSDLRPWAEVIPAGQRVVIQPDRVRL